MAVFMNLSEDYECAKCHHVMAVRYGCEPTKYCDDCAHAIVEKLEQKVRPAKKATREPGYYNAFLLGLPMGKVAFIEPSEQGQHLRAAQRMRMQVVTAKTTDGGMLLVRMKLGRRYTKCPHCGNKIV